MKRGVFAVLLALAASTSAQASELSWNYVEAGYLRTNLSGLPNPDGWRIGGSVALGSRFHLFGDWAPQEFSVAGVDVDYDTWSLGFGYNHALNQRTDLVARLAYEKIDFGSGIDAEGASLEVGVRGLIGSRFEGWAMAGYFDARRSSGDAYAKLGGQFRFTPSFGLVVESTFADGDNRVFVGPRLTF